jgi:hypothetical protein
VAEVEREANEEGGRRPPPETAEGDSEAEGDAEGEEANEMSLLELVDEAGTTVTPPGPERERGAPDTVRLEPVPLKVPFRRLAGN